MSTHTPAVDTPALTADGRRHLETRLERVTAELSALQALIKSGDATDEQVGLARALEDDAGELRRVLDHARDIASVDEDPSIVEIGDAVDVEFGDGDVVTYALVHPAEIRFGDDRISAASPMGRALLGARVGDRVEVDAPAGAYTCTVRDRRRLA